jgi:hypothetical protein
MLGGEIVLGGVGVWSRAGLCGFAITFFSPTWRVLVAAIGLMLSA